MKVKVTPCEFIRLLQAAKEIDREFPWLFQVTWLLDCWTDFSDGYVSLSRLNSPPLKDALAWRPQHAAQTRDRPG